jgi:hypothetical protein
VTGAASSRARPSTTNRVLVLCLACLVVLILWKSQATHGLMLFFVVVGVLTLGITGALVVLRRVGRYGRWIRFDVGDDVSGGGSDGSGGDGGDAGQDG